MVTAVARTSPQLDPGSASLPNLSTSFEPLRDVVSSLRAAQAGKLPRGASRERLLRRVRSAGIAALPSLMRALSGPHAGAAAWAHALLVALGGEAVQKRLEAVLADPRPSDDVKVRVLAVLADLGVPLSHQVTLRDPQAVMSEAVRELIASLEGPGAVGEAVDLLFESVPEDELLGVLTEIVQSGGAATQPLVAGVIADPRTPPSVARSLTGMVRPALRSKARRPEPQFADRVHERLERALELIQRGQPGEARRRLEALQREHADAADVASALGLCLLRLGQPAAALEPLARAAELEPHVAVHAWNVAAAAQAAGPGHEAVCRAHLHHYLSSRDSHPGAAARRRAAETLRTQTDALAQQQRPHLC